MKNLPLWQVTGYNVKAHSSLTNAMKDLNVALCFTWPCMWTRVCNLQCDFMPIILTLLISRPLLYARVGAIMNVVETLRMFWHRSPRAATDIQRRKGRGDHIPYG